MVRDQQVSAQRSVEMVKNLPVFREPPKSLMNGMLAPPDTVGVDRPRARLEVRRKPEAVRRGRNEATRFVDYVGRTLDTSFQSYCDQIESPEFFQLLSQTRELVAPEFFDNTDALAAPFGPAAHGIEIVNLGKVSVLAEKNEQIIFAGGRRCSKAGIYAQ
jgi:hypothetical protein